ncbi:MAG: hypothetical protein WD035_03930 [Balneolaceae bacterium]
MSGDQNEKDSFEEFFQKKAEEYDIPYREEDWMKLKKKLDLQDAKINYRKRVRWIAAAAVLIVSLLGYFTYENHNRLNQISRQLNDEVTSETEQPLLDGELTENLEDQSTEADAEAEESSDEGSLAVNDSSEGDDGGHGNSFDLTSKPNLPVSEMEVNEGSEPAGPDLLNSDDGITRREVKDVQLVSYNIVPKHPFFYYTNRAMVPTATELASSNGSWDLSDKQTGNDFISSSTSRFTIGVATAPDLSTAGSISNFYDPGYKLGFTIEYSLGPNLSISTGILQSNVRYSARNREYNPPVYWKDGIQPDEIIAVCRLLDIPVSLKYDFMNFDRSRFFATAGVSSYIMLNEEYDFNYQGDDTGLMQRWSGKTGTGHWISNASFSVGYELDIHRNWSLRAEPFLKVPLNEVGWGNVNLYSMGSFISIHHNL